MTDARPDDPPQQPQWPAPSASLCQALRERLGPSGYKDAPDDLQPWLTDWRGVIHGRAAAMLTPDSLAAVADIVRMTAAEGIALVPQGGNSGMVGGATPDASGNSFLVSMRRMNRVRSIDVAARRVVAEAGVILSDLHDAVAAHGLRFPLTLGGKGSATIGGLISTNAGGTQVLRHGTMRALTAGVEAVLPDGTLLDALSDLRKDNRGYSPREVLVGAEGTLGIVTAATLRLVPAIATRTVAWVGVASPDAALTLLRQLDRALGPALEGFELIPQSCVEAVVRHIPGTRAPLSAAAPWQVLIETVVDTDAPADAAAALGGRVERALTGALDAGVISDAVLAKNDAEADQFWRIRDSISEAERAQGPAIQHDVSVPVDAMPAFIAQAAAMAHDRHGARVISFGHLGDGNVHHHVQPPRDCADPKGWLAEHGPALSADVYRLVTDMGGSISAEHGIGQIKRATLAALTDPGRIALLRGIKQGLDPSARFNPGKLVP